MIDGGIITWAHTDGTGVDFRPGEPAAESVSGSR